MLSVPSFRSGLVFSIKSLILSGFPFLCLAFLLTSFYREIKTIAKPSTSYLNWPRVLLFDLDHKQCKDIIKGWLHCLTSESNGRFLINNILMLGSIWCLITAQIQFFLIKKIKIGLPEHLPTLYSPTSSNISFLPYPPALLRVDAICVSPLTYFQSIRISYVLTSYVIIL